MVKCSWFQLSLPRFKSSIWPLAKVGLGSTKFNSSAMLVFIANWLPSGQLGLLPAAFSINKLISVLICENYWVTRNCVTYSCTTTIYKGIFFSFWSVVVVKSNTIMVAHSRSCFNASCRVHWLFPSVYLEHHSSLLIHILLVSFPLNRENYCNSHNWWQN